MPKRYITVFDTETTGFDPREDYIYQIAAVTLAIEKDGIREVGQTEIKLELDRYGKAKLRELKDKKPEVVLYDPDVWAEKAIPPEMGLRQFTRYLEPYSWIPKKSKRGTTYYTALMAGHNVDFDLKMVRAFYKRHELFFPGEYWGLDTVGLCRWVATMDPSNGMPENFKLGTLSDYYELGLENAHDAMADVRATVEIIKAVWS